MSKKLVAALVGVCFAGSVMLGCGGTKKPMNDYDAQMAEKLQKISKLETELQKKDQDLQSAKKSADRAAQEAARAREMAERASSSASATPVAVNPDDYMLPPKAEAGECYARVLIPPKYESGTEQVLKKQASSRVEILPAQYEWVEQEVLVKEASERLEVIPAEYGWEEEEVLVNPARTELKVVPAQYGWETEKVLVSPARTFWKKGRGPVEKVDNSTGEIMCLVEEPAIYDNVRTRVLVKPESTTKVELPAEYKTVKKRVLRKPATTRKVTIPAEYKTVRVRREARPATEKRIEIPAEYQTVTKRSMVAPSRMEWRPILCETNATRETVMDIQRALKAAGHDPGPIDGIIGSQTASAVKSYQRSNKLPEGALTFATIRSLGVQTTSRR